MPIENLDDLRKGRLPKMVRWYDPRLLAKIGVRTIVSNVFGQYADQRLIQAATDQADSKALKARYDFRDPTPEDPMQRVALDQSGAFWVDYLADTGDGFECTYTMAYLLAIDQLKVPGLAQPLPAGDTLIMGGDQCYPQATREGYKHRLMNPFSWAFDVPKPQRKLFAIPGNHDWYDGLNAFDSLFCSSRDKLSETKGNAIGGWQCQQHRSYWALRLPYNWWIWGPDIQFSKYLDAAQINYFELIAGQMSEGDNLVICISEPDWLLSDIKGEDDEEENFLKITTIARKRGARVCAVLAGDWHHYNRYAASDIGVHFITAGGGGAFLHPTHILRENISVRWPQQAEPAADPTAGPEAASAAPDGRWKARDVDIKLRKGKASRPDQEAVREVGEVVSEVLEPIDEAIRGKNRVKPTRLLKQEAPVCYPSKGLSRLLGFRNLLFPIYNFPFALSIGVIYWLVTWQFYSVVERHDISAGKIDAVGLHTGYFETFGYFPLYLVQACLVSIPLAGMLGALLAVLIWYVDAVEQPRWRHWLSKIVIGASHFAAHLTAMFAVGFFFVMLNNWTSPYIEREVNAIWQQSNATPTAAGRAVKEILEPLSSSRAGQREAFGDKTSAPGQQRRAAPPATALPDAKSSSDAKAAAASGADPLVTKNVRQVVGFVLYPLQAILFGGLVGGFVFGLYWVITSVALRMHASEAFAALRIKDYKNFLRMRFDRDTLTIYPIGVDKIPRRRFWQAPTSAQRLSHAPRFMASGHIDVRLIEKPIVITAKG
jgi:hypothetical protein